MLFIIKYIKDRFIIEKYMVKYIHFFPLFSSKTRQEWLVDNLYSVVLCNSKETSIRYFFDR